MSRFFLQETKSILVISHFLLVCVLDSRIIFILGRKEQYTGMIAPCAARVLEDGGSGMVVVC